MAGVRRQARAYALQIRYARDGDAKVLAGGQSLIPLLRLRVARPAKLDARPMGVERGNLRRARKGKVQGGGRGFAMPGWQPKPEGWEPGRPTA